MRVEVVADGPDAETLTRDLIAATSDEATAEVNRLLTAHTPMRSGKARTSWRTTAYDNGDIVARNSVPYMRWLERGRNSPHRHRLLRLLEQWTGSKFRVSRGGNLRGRR